MIDRLVSQKWDRNVYFCCLGIYAVLALSALNSGITSWDEETDYLGIRTQMVHALQLLKHQPSDYRNIHANLEYYGVVGLLPAWILWFVQQSKLTSRLTLNYAFYHPAAEHQLTGFFTTSHFVLATEFVLLSLLVVIAARLLDVSFPWLAGGMCLLLLSLLGHSFVNAKDIPFALFYTAYTVTLLQRHRSEQSRWLGLSILAAALLINLKSVFVLPLLLSEALLVTLQGSSRRHIFKSSLVFLGSTLLSLALQPSAWGLSPLRYFSEGFHTFASHEWGGCMFWGGRCVGVHDPSWSTAVYMWQWVSVKFPLLLIMLILFQLIWLLRKVPHNLYRLSK